MSQSSLLLQRQQKEIARQRQELERLQKLLAQQPQQPQPQQPQPKQPQPQQQQQLQTNANVPTGNSVGPDVTAVAAGADGPQTNPPQGNSVGSGGAGLSPVAGVPGADNLIVSGTGTGKGSAVAGKPSGPAPVVNAGTTPNAPVNKQ